MQNKVLNFKSFLNEVSLEGNRGIPGEGGDAASSWLKKTGAEKGERMAEFERENRQDIMRFMQLVGRSQEIQRGHEEELSVLAEDAFRELFGSLLDDVMISFKIGQEARQMLQETPDEVSVEQRIESIDDERILSEIERRKILRTLQQGKGLTSKAILNLPMFKNGVRSILGGQAEEYLDTLNKISSISQFNDWRFSEEFIKNALRGGAAGACKIEFEEKELPKSDEEAREKEKSAEDLLDEILNGESLEDSEAAANLVQGVGASIIARGVDMSVLIHEAIKAVYNLPLQLSLEHLYGEGADLVVSNTDTLLDEAQEFKYGPDMQGTFYRAISSEPEVKKRLDEYRRNLKTDGDWDALGSFEERLFWMVYGLLAVSHQEDAREMLKIVYSVLSEDQRKIGELFHPLVAEALRNLDAEEAYQRTKGKATPVKSVPSMEEEPQEESPIQHNLSSDEINDLILDAFEKGGKSAADAVRKKYLGESSLWPYEVWIKINS
jgi:hypothetical protein